MLENLPVGMPGTGFISKGIIATLFAFGVIYYFSDNTGQKVKM